MKKSDFFTLAEVLITLGIIGTVAAMTIPTLMQNTQTQELKTAYRKVFSAISQATIQLASDNGGTLEGAFTDADTEITLFASKLKTIGDVCKSTDGACYINPASSEVSTVKLADGSIIGTCTAVPTCVSVWGTNNFGQDFCGELYVDVNGYKNPNKNGQDIFWIGIGKTQAVPAGTFKMVNPGWQCPDGAFCNGLKYLQQ